MIQRRTQEQVTNANKLRTEVALLTKHQIQQAEKVVDEHLESLYTKLFQKLPRVICVVDFDCFFCAVEQLDRPDLAKKPMIVAGGSIVCASNYPARRYGIRSAMPVRICKELCQELVVIQANSSKYEAMSRRAGQVFSQFDPNYHMLSVDEGELDLTQLVFQQMKSGAQRDSETNFLCDPSPIEEAASVVVRQLRDALSSQLRITASAGASYSAQVAKICADQKKPNGQTVTKLVFANSHQILDTVKATLFKMDARALWGVGSATETLVKTAFNIAKVGDFYEKRGVLWLVMTKSIMSLVEAACGLQSMIEGFSSADAKSIGNESTFVETSDIGKLSQILMGLCKQTCARMMNANKTCRRIQVKLRFADWSDTCHVEDVPESDQLDIVYTAALKIMKSLLQQKQQKSGSTIVQVGFGDDKNDCSAAAVRLIGVKCLEFEAERGVGQLRLVKMMKRDTDEITREPQIKQKYQPSDAKEQQVQDSMEIIDIRSSQSFEVINEKQPFVAQIIDGKKKVDAAIQKKTGPIDAFLHKK